MLNVSDLIELYKTMLTIRLFEEHVVDMFARGQVPGLTHAYIGEEAIAAGVCASLRRAHGQMGHERHFPRVEPSKYLCGTNQGDYAFLHLECYDTP